MNTARKWKKLPLISLFANSVFMTCAIGAVSALAKFGAQNEEMLPSILVLLKRWVSPNGMGTNRFFRDPAQNEGAMKL